MSNDRLKFRVWSEKLKRYYWEMQLTVDGDLVPSKWLEPNSIPDLGRIVIEQCTGLTDKNGNLIFEGDRCRVYDSKTGQPVKDTVYEVVFTESASGGCACFCFRVYHGANPNPYGTRPIYANGLPNIEIIGNIHEDQFREVTKMVEGEQQ
jgi:hypothetical protein